MDNNKAVVILSFVILIVIAVGFYALIQVRSQAIQCYAKPASCFFKALQKNNPNAFVSCSCTLSKGGSSIKLGLNESGEYLLEDLSKSPSEMQMPNLSIKIKP